METKRWSSWASGPKSAQIPEFVRKQAMVSGVEVEKLTVEKRWFTETVFFTVTGNSTAVPLFAAAFHQALTDFGATVDA